MLCEEWVIQHNQKKMWVFKLMLENIIIHIQEVNLYDKLYILSTLRHSWQSRRFDCWLGWFFHYNREMNVVNENTKAWVI